MNCPKAISTTEFKGNTYQTCNEQRCDHGHRYGNGLGCVSKGNKFF